MILDLSLVIKETYYYATGGTVAAPTVKKIINEMIPRLRVEPEVDKENNILHNVKLEKQF